MGLNIAVSELAELPGPIDLNVGCGHWAMYPTDSADPECVHHALSSRGFKAACVYALETYFYPDPHEANVRLLSQVSGSAFFIPSAVINPTLPGHLEVALECIESWGARLIRFMPGFHGYKLENALLHDVCSFLAPRRVALAIHIRAEDERSQNPLCPVLPVKIESVVQLATQYPELNIIAMGALLSEVRGLSLLPNNLYFDSSFIEPADSFDEAKDAPLLENLVFGSHYPLFYAGAGLLKISRMRLSTRRKTDILRNTATKLLGLETTVDSL